MDLTQIYQLIIQPVLNAFGPPFNSQAAAVLLLGTAIHESNFQYIAQLDGGPALGFWQMEPFTHNDCWQNFLNYQPTLASAVRQFQVPGAGAQQMVYNAAYACAMARVKYIRAQPPLPNQDDFTNLALYYKQYYNSDLGAAVVDPALVNCFQQAATIIGC